MNVFVVINPDGSVAVSVEAMYDDDGNIIRPDVYEGPFEVEEGFEKNQHLYKLMDGKLVYDAKYADELAVRERQGTADDKKRAAADATYKRLLAKMMAQASPEDADALAPLLGE